MPFFFNTSKEHTRRREWYAACENAAKILSEQVPEYYRNRSFSGIIGDIKVLSSRKALSLLSRKKGLGVQYSRLYLTQGIDQGYGYQACASEALYSFLDDMQIFKGRILDAGCAIGVSAGVLSLDSIYGFDLFPDIVKTARLVDSLGATNHKYTVADMTKTWPYATSFDTVIAGLVCHHLKEQPDVYTFFYEANRVMNHGGHFIITLPSGTVATASQFQKLIESLQGFGFQPLPEKCGMILSLDNTQSTFWSFIITAEKTGPVCSSSFYHDKFSFTDIKTPVSRTVKADKARRTAVSSRKTKHSSFVHFNIDELLVLGADELLTFETMKRLSKNCAGSN